MHEFVYRSKQAADGFFPFFTGLLRSLWCCRLPGPCTSLLDGQHLSGRLDGNLRFQFKVYSKATLQLPWSKVMGSDFPVTDDVLRGL